MLDPRRLQLRPLAPGLGGGNVIGSLDRVSTWIRENLILSQEGIACCSPQMIFDESSGISFGGRPEVIRYQDFYG